MATNTNLKLKAKLRSSRQIKQAGRGFSMRLKPKPNGMQTKTLRRWVDPPWTVQRQAALTGTEVTGELRRRHKLERQNRRRSR